MEKEATMARAIESNLLLSHLATVEQREHAHEEALGTDKAIIEVRVDKLQKEKEFEEQRYEMEMRNFKELQSLAESQMDPAAMAAATPPLQKEAKAESKG